MAADLTGPAGRRGLTLVVGALAICLAVSVGGRGILVGVANLYPDALPPHPYLVPGQALLLYLAMPVVLLATLATLMAPGILLVAASGGSPRAGDFAIRAFGLSYAVRVTAHSIAKLAGLPLDLGAWLTIEIVLDTALAYLALHRAGKSGVAWPEDPDQRRRLGWMLAIPVATVVLMLPMVFWQDFTEDGLEGLEIGRSLLVHVIPRFPNDSGIMGLGVGMLSMAPAVHWFLVLMGPLEAAARLPIALYLPVLFGLLVELIEWRASPLTARGEAVLVLALAVYVVTMSYSASYAPYSADVAAPAAFETLTVLCIAAALLFLWQGRTGWMLAFAVAGYLARPTGLLVPGLLLIATFIAVPGERRPWMIRLALAIGACLAVFVVYEKLWVPAASGPEGPGYPSSSILDRLQYLVLTDWRRVLFMAVPAGILPLFAMAAWKRQDPLSRQITLFCLAYFLFFYPQAFVALHHFVPVMVLPLVVFWRTVPALRAPWLVPAAAAATALCLWLSLPPTFAVDRTFRRIGQVTDYRIGNWNGSREEFRRALAPRAVLDSLFRRDWLIEDPARELVGTATGLIYYAAREPHRGTAVNYVVQDSAAPAPEGFSWIATRRGASVFVRDRERWRQDRYTPPPTDFRSGIYAIPRETMFNFLGIPARRYQVDLASDVPFLWRLF